MSSELQFLWRDGGNHAAATDLVDIALDRHAVELVDRQRDKQLNAVFESDIGVAEGTPLLGVRALHRGGIGDTPMGGHRVPRPDRTNLAGSLIADGENEVQRWRARLANSFQLLLCSRLVSRCAFASRS